MRTLLIILLATSACYSQNFGVKSDKADINPKYYIITETYKELIEVNDSCDVFNLFDLSNDNFYGVSYVYQNGESASEALKIALQGAYKIDKRVWINNGNLILSFENEIAVIDVRYIRRKARRSKK